jgi:class 3 adenylate cyclase
MEIPETRYATRSDGVSIAYQVLGEGPVNLVFCAGMVSHLDLQWTNPGITHFFRRLASFSRLALYDKAGTGVSDPIANVPTLEERIDEIRAVMDAAGMERAALFGESEGGPAALLFAATYPERTTGLIVYGSLVKGDPTDAELAASGRSREHEDAQWVRFGEVLDAWGQGRSLELLAPSLADNRAAKLGFALFERAAVSPAMVKAIVESYRRIDVTPVLGAISTPTLVLHRTGDFVPIDGGRLLAQEIEGARFVELEGTDHAYFTQDSDAILDEVERFLTGATAAARPDRVLATVMFTDIVDSTARAAALGDARWRELLERHDALVRTRVEGAGGRLVKSTGDGALATFDGPARAIRCAEAVLTQAADELDLQLRAGVHTGECEAIGEDLGGLAVHIGARVAAKAEPGQVLVSSTVKELVVGSGLTFTDRGEHELKGVPDSWRLFAVGPERAPAQPLEPAEAHMSAADRASVRLARRAPGLLRTVGRLTLRERSAQPGSR